MANSLLKCIILFLEIYVYICQEELKLKVVTVATDETDGYLRFMRSAEINKLDVEVFGLHEKWLGGDMDKGPGGGHKLNILREGLKKYKDDKNLILMFTDSYDVVFASGESEIMEKFKKSGANIFISAEDFVWPDRSLEGRYPLLSEDGYRYLCSGGIIGFAPALYEIITLKSVKHTDDDQLYYTHIYLDDREKYNIKLDHRANLFQNLNGNKDHVEVQSISGFDVRVINKRFNTTPVVIHGNGPSKLFLNHLGNYVPKQWTDNNGCMSCEDNIISLENINKDDWPTVLIAVFIPTLTPFIDPFLRQIPKLDYPKNKIDIFIHNVYHNHIENIEAWVREFEGLYKSVTYKEHKNMFLTEHQGRNFGMFHWRKVKTEYYFSIDSSVTLTNMRTLQILIEQNRTILAPMISKHQQLWTNFWGDVSQTGFYARSPDYLDIVKNLRWGVWNAAHISEIYLINSTAISRIGDDPFRGEKYDADIQFCANLRTKGIFMYVTNMEHFGHLKDMETYNTQAKHNDLYQLFVNKLDWEEKYLHPNFTRYLAKDSDIPQPCQDVFWVPVVTETFANDLIEECEHYGQWSGGKHEDARINSGYENVPTVDIHMNQIGLESQWLEMLKEYFSPMATRIFSGYNSKNNAIMNFVVKYTPSGQFFLRPHHDISTYTVNMALNKVGEDYEGGGSRFLRYNCSVPDTKVGWALLHPGRLTHMHEGLPVTKGTRYIMVSFVDP